MNPIAPSTSFSPAWLCCGCLLVATGCQRELDLQHLRQFDQAQQVFDQARTADDYLRAASLYQQLVDAGWESGALYYNLGNCFYRAQRRGQALAAYRQAQRYLPQDRYLQANLDAVLGEVPRPAADRSLLDYLFFWQSWLGYDRKFHLLAVAALTSFSLGVIALFWPRARLRQLAWIALAITLVLAASAAYDWYRYEAVRHGVLIRDQVIARKGNAASFEPAFTEPLPEGTEFVVLEHRQGWTLILVGPGREGWIPREDAAVF